MIIIHSLSASTRTRRPCALPACSPVAACAAAIALPAYVEAQEKVLNLYTARHYQTDEALYANFTKKTGIRINRIEAPEDPLLERSKRGREHARRRVHHRGRRPPVRAQQAGVFAPLHPPCSSSAFPPVTAIPKATGSLFGRARVIAYNKDVVKPGDVKLRGPGRPEMEGQVCTRSSGTSTTCR
jgi:iron(III) transport system substrate-binding protein